MPATMHHFIQEHGIGPLSVNYLKPGHNTPHQ
jgi:hypothetical protein